VRAPVKIAAFVGGVGIVLGAAALAGASLDPIRDPAPSSAHGSEAGHGHGEGHGGDEAVEGGRAPAAGDGLAVAQGGYRLAFDAATFARQAPATATFRIIGPDGAAVTDYEVEHERKMHLIVVRRDLTGYQHLHPRLGKGGRWVVGLRLATGGVYRAFADFSAGGRSRTLATDLVVPGRFAPEALPGPAPAAAVGPHHPELARAAVRSGETAEIAYSLSRAGRPVDVEPYLGADGHLVALREGDLAFAHVHPERSTAEGRIRFGAALPSAGRYRLFLQFKDAGRVRTVAHTLVVAR
jgi:hypothetical protein